MNARDRKHALEWVDGKMVDGARFKIVPSGDGDADVARWDGGRWVNLEPQDPDTRRALGVFAAEVFAAVVGP